MEGDDVAGREELLLAGDSVYTFLLDDFGRREGVVSIDIHAEALSDASYVAARVTVSEEAKLLILSSVPEVPLKRLRTQKRSIAKTSSATALAFCPGVFITHTP